MFIYRMKRIVLLLVLIIGCICMVQAQSDAQFSQYNMALGYYNPASAGRSGDLDVIALYRMQWLGWEVSPKILFINANMPFKFMKKEHGIGVVVTSDNASSQYKYLTAGLQYAFLKKIGKGTLRVGTQLGMMSISTGSDNMITPSDSTGDGTSGGNGGDEAIPTSKTESKVFDMNLGVYYATDKWYVGAAVMHLLEPEIDDENLLTYVSRGYNFIGGYNIRFENSLFELQPSVFVQTNFNITKADLTAKAVYAKKYSAGLSWRLSDSQAGNDVVLLLGAVFGKIEGGYAYDIPVSKFGKGSMGSHELFLKYRLQLNKPKTGKSKHKSVRIL